MSDVDAHGVITREQFEEEAKPVLDRLLAPVQKVGLGWEPLRGRAGGGRGGLSGSPAIAAPAYCR